MTANTSPRLFCASRGVAMVIALLMTAVLSLFALQVSLVSKQQVEMASDAQIRADNLAIAHSLEAELIFNLLTRSWAVDEALGDPSRSTRDWVRLWNFRGEPFEVDGSIISIQDESGLLSVPQPGGYVGLFAELLRQIGVVSTRADRIARDLAELQFAVDSTDSVRIPTQSLHELVDFSGLTFEELAQLRALTTLYPVSHFNPDTAPDPVLRVFFPDKSDTLIRLRLDRERNSAFYQRELRSVTDDSIALSVGPALRWSIKTTRMGRSYARGGTIVVQPYLADPISVWSYRRIDR